MWIRDPVYFITTCTITRRPVLACDIAHAICVEVWENARRLYRWHVGRYVIMPDHVHFFCVADRDATPLSTFVGKWKEWTAKYLHDRAGLPPPLWQEEFFDHVLRSSESYTKKWEYVRENPARAGLVTTTQDWPYQGYLTEFPARHVERM
ncbi:MAG: REP-associated tyrosine transposase [Verrucomicrobiales bacterium]